jgi:hypothetical protein
MIVGRISSCGRASRSRADIIVGRIPSSFVRRASQIELFNNNHWPYSLLGKQVDLIELTDIIVGRIPSCGENK